MVRVTRLDLCERWHAGERSHDLPRRTLTAMSTPGAEQSDLSPVRLTTGLPETVLPEESEQVRSGLEAALAQPGERRRHAVSDVVRAAPRSQAAWAALGALARDDVEAYACFRVGYHRGLDALRAAGWKGSGLVRWEHRRTGDSCAVSMVSGRLPAPSASTPKRIGVPSSCVSWTQPGAPIGPVSRPSGGLDSDEAPDRSFDGGTTAQSGPIADPAPLVFGRVTGRRGIVDGGRMYARRDRNAGLSDLRMVDHLRRRRRHRPGGSG